MNCINCGARINDERKTCPYCGKSLQIVPDYSVFDDDDISILMEATTPPQTSAPKVEPEKPAQPKAKKPVDKETAERIKARKEREKQLELERKKKIQLTIVLVAVVFICVILFVAFFVISDMVEKNNATSFDYQVKQAESAIDAGDFELAESYYLRALELEPNDTDVRFTLADLYKNHDMPEKMIEMYNQIIAIEGQNYTAYKALFQYYNSINDVDAILELRSTVTNDRIMALFQNYAVESPKIYLEGGTYNGAIDVMISSKLDYEIYYTIDGSDPTKNGNLYTGTLKIDQTGMVTLKAAAKNEIGVFSNVVQETYYLEFEAPAAPVVLPDGGTFDTVTYIQIIVPSGCTAYYSWDGIDPTIDSQTKFEYTEAFVIPSGENVLRVIIYDNKTGLASETYRKIFTCTVEGIEVPIIVIPEETESDDLLNEGADANSNDNT